MTQTYLPGSERGKYMRYDTAVILKRFYLCEKELVVGEAGWIPGIPYFDMKTLLPKILWEDAMTANALRERVFELRFPSRILEVGEDQQLIDLIQRARSAPNALAFLSTLAHVFKPALLQAYQTYLRLADHIGDGPTYRFMNLAVEEKQRQIREISLLLERESARADHADRVLAEQWTNEIQERLQAMGGIGLDAPVAEAEQKETALGNQPAAAGESAEALSHAIPFAPMEVPARDGRFIHVRFYWPDNVDPSFPYGEGFRLQLRSAVSHLNEIWAVENAGHVLYSFAGELGWEFIYDAARWVYDESRHCRMGYERLRSWGFEEAELPLGTYIYDSCKGQDPIYRLGMLFYFESKNIGKKLDRIKNFESMNDRTSQHDMDFDWADETIHTSYGKTWLSAALKKRGQDPDDYTEIKEMCESIVKRTVETATAEEIEKITEIANRMIAKGKAAQ
ncbi:DUF455 family protein [Brevibacillus borstelensis]|uniref:DUF455 family protein n=1 Tax=Brevibacillus borstelensis TaxID=45462 RepID=UPI00116F2AD1|nr:DUF455 family protein [Brevibacillus borstelensis]MED1881937.1 DUF455 family protein [Brevibacillus borstelensis]MED2008343.1 DUF455 family protein [Brevibacillus borstelensis]WNF07574.1 DUF455 family protein [Brevibacillus borstelensis]GED54081.1 hypothetical protein BBO01nite_33220 [Brevibacillus borstelensis]